MSFLRYYSPPAALTLLVVGALLATGTHTIQSGETLTGIAAQNGVSVSALAEANDISDHNHIQAGQMLTIPGSSSADQHQVARGETLAAIARRYGVSMSTLASLNGLANPDLLRAGGTLDIPDHTSRARHTVGAGEPLAAVVRPPGASMASLIAANGLDDPDHIQVGQSLTLPTGTTASAPDSSPSPAPAASPTGTVHEVSRGETLASIARLHGVSTATLAQANSIADPNLLKAGKTLAVPTSTTASPSPQPAVGADSTLPSNGELPTAIVNNPDKAALGPVFDTWANAFGVPADLVKAIAWVESGWDPNALSDVGAIGIGQLLAPTASFIAEDLLNDPSLDPADARDNIQMTTRWVRYLLDRTHSDREAVAAYYQGLAAVQHHGVYATTIAYVDGVMDARQGF